MDKVTILSATTDIRIFLVELFRMLWCGLCVLTALTLLYDIWQVFHDPFYAEYLWKEGGSEIWGYRSRLEYVGNTIYTILLILPGAILGIYWKKTGASGFSLYILF